MTTSTAEAESAEQLIERYRLPDTPVYFVGTFDKGITVLSQQVRALNLAWALVESRLIPIDPTPAGDGSPRKRIAIVGAGFAGLTVAAGLLKKRVSADITLFERRDTVLPLQHGSDSRWLHPHIYDWPKLGSEAYSAALPVLNWTASRASDVVVQVLNEWAYVVDNSTSPQPEGNAWATPSVNIYCNTRHILISDGTEPETMTVEWIGEQRTGADPAVPSTGKVTAVGDSQAFDIVVLTVGFGLESGAQHSMSYWRNETLAQPQLGQARGTYIVSGSGDGAMIDTFRLRISHYRQDRILADLFRDHDELLRRLRDEFTKAPSGVAFDILRSIWEDTSIADSTMKVQNRLRNRLRQDTTVLLAVRKPSFKSLFDGKRVSFQNRLLAYLLYRCGAFTLVVAPEEADVARLAAEYLVPNERIVVRRGTENVDGTKDALSNGLRDKVEQCASDATRYLQSDTPHWRGGYFDMPGLMERTHGHASDSVKRAWRKEYLPSPMEAIATVFCAAIAGLIANATESASRLRVTLHRTVITGDEVVLQQCCDYQGISTVSTGRAGRTFPSHNGTIGAAFSLARFVRTKHGATKDAIGGDMAALSLNEASQSMAVDVSSIAAIPLLGARSRVLPGQTQNVLGVVYLDSYDENVFVDSEMMGQVIHMCGFFLASLPALTSTSASRIANSEFWGLDALRDDELPTILPQDWQALETVDVELPRTDRLRRLNFDYSDFTPVEQT